MFRGPTSTTTSMCERNQPGIRRGAQNDRAPVLGANWSRTTSRGGRAHAGRGPLVAGVMWWSHEDGRSVEGFLVRKVAKAPWHAGGQRGGQPRRSTSALAILDDVITSWVRARLIRGAVAPSRTRPTVVRVPLPWSTASRVHSRSFQQREPTLHPPVLDRRPVARTEIAHKTPEFHGRLARSTPSETGRKPAPAPPIIQRGRSVHGSPTPKGSSACLETTTSRLPLENPSLPATKLKFG